MFENIRNIFFGKGWSELSPLGSQVPGPGCFMVVLIEDESHTIAGMNLWLVSKIGT